MTLYPACAKTALRIGDNTFSRAKERIAGLILYPSNLSCITCGRSILLKDAESK
jgi:hypothetical protein